MVPASPNDKDTDSPRAASRRQVADRPHDLSVILSALALGISLLSWWEAHDSRVANQSANRAVLIADEAGVSNAPPGSDNRIDIWFKNAGRSTANASGFWWGTETMYEDEPEEFHHSPHYFQPRNPQFVRLKPFNSEIAPGARYPLGFSSALEQPKPPRPFSEAIVYLYGEVRYRDEATGRDFTDRWCFTMKKGATVGCELAPVPPDSLK